MTTKMMPDRSDGVSATRVVRIMGLVGLLFLAGLGVGTIVGGFELPAPFAEAGGAGGDTHLASGSWTDRFAVEAAPAQSRPEPLSGGRLTPTVIAAREVGPSVVSIRTISTVTGPVSIFDQFTGRSQTRNRPGLGSGFVVDAQGHVLTNHHVVRGADRIEVVDQQGRRLPAEVVGTDELTDLAVIRIQAGVVPAAPLGTSADLVVGEPAIAIGNPSGFQLANTEATVTTGVVSGVGRDIQSESQEVLYADMIQTDAAINPGNSGGPLVNADGRVIGVNSSIFSRSGGSEGLGFAIPVDRALRVAAELIEVGRVRRPWVGLDVVSEPTDDFLRLPLVGEVYPDTPGERAGFRTGDVILSVNGREIRHDLDWQVALVDAGVNAVAAVRYRRGDQVVETRLALEEIPSARAERIEVLSGLQLISVSAQIQQERGLAIEFGALIVDIEASVARITRLRQGDVIFGINGNEVRSVEEAAQLFNYYGNGGDTEGWVRVHVVRGRQRGAFNFRVG